jgi:hypothetical protein
MWGGAGKHVLGHSAAELDPFRWSLWMQPPALIKNLEEYRQANAARPVEMMVGHEGGTKMSFGSIHEAETFLVHYEKDPSHLPHAPAGPSPPVATTPASTPTQTQVGAPHPQQPQPMHPAPQQPTPIAPAAAAAAPGSSHLGAAGVPGHAEKGGGPLAHLVLGLSAVVMMASCAGGCCWCARKQAKAPMADAVDGADTCCDGNNGSDFEDNYPNTSQALRGAFAEGELKSLLAEADGDDGESLGNQDPRLALPPSPRSSPAPQTPSRAQRAEAEREVERILEAKDAKNIFGDGTASQQRAEYRRLIRLLHPDKGLASGQRATLALRRVVEANTALTGSAAS